MLADVGANTHLCEAEEESDASEDLQSFWSMIKHQVPAALADLLVRFTRLEWKQHEKNEPTVCKLNQD